MSSIPHLPLDRRPIAARSWLLSRRVSGWLARRGFSPNSISIAGMIAGLAAGGLLASTAIDADFGRFAWLAAGLLIVIRLLANMFDGMVAIETNRSSPVGELFNEVPDRISDAAILIGLGFARGGDPLLGCFAALAAVFTAYVRAMGKVAGVPQDYRGPMAKQHRMWVVMLVCGVGLIAPGFLTTPMERLNLTLPAVALMVIIAGCLLTAARRLLGAAAILRSRP